MRLLVITQYFDPEEFRINELVYHLVKKGHKVDVITGIPNYPNGKFYKGYNLRKRFYQDSSGLNIVRVPIFPRANGKALALLLNYISFVFSATFYFRKLTKTKSYDFIIGNQLSPVTSILPIFIFNSSTIPVLTWVLDIWPESFNATFKRRIKIIDRVVYNLSRKVYESSDLLLVTSPIFKKYLKQNFKVKNDIIFFPNWIESNFESSKGTTIDFDLPSGFNVVFAGNIGEAQGFDEILKSIELLKKEPINWIIVGDGRMKNWMTEQKEKLQLCNLFLYDRKPVKMMKDLYLKSDCLLLPLKGGSLISETIPGKLPGYLTAGKPILGILNGDGKKIINNNQLGIACSAGDYTELALNAKRLSKMSVGELKILGENCLRYSRRFDRNSLFQKFEEILLENTKIN
jgi:glycosyltransferase involved in cell wall biosynthesis